MVDKGRYSDIDDIHVVAYLVHRGHTFDTYKNDRGRVMFRVYGEDVADHLREMHEGDAVPVTKFLYQLRYVRGKLFRELEKKQEVTLLSKETTDG